MAAARTGLTQAQRDQIERAYLAGPDTYIRATCAGERVTLASLHGRGLMVRRVWSRNEAAAARGAYASPAHEYQLAPHVRAYLQAKVAARRAGTTPTLNMRVTS